MYAVLQTGGKQYRVAKGDVICVEKLPVEVGGSVTFEEILAVGEGSDVRIGSPFVEGASVEGTVTEVGKAPKVIIYKYKAKKNYRKKRGHRQPYSLVEIDAINAGTGKAKAPAKKEEPAKVKEEVKAKPAKSEKPVEAKKAKPAKAEKPAEAKKAKPAKAKKPAEAEKPAEAKKAEPKKTPSLRSMKKAELIAYAEENGIAIDKKATNAEMIAAIEAALQ